MKTTRFINILIIDPLNSIKENLKQTLIGKGNNIILKDDIIEAVSTVIKRNIGIILINIDALEDIRELKEFSDKISSLENRYIIAISEKREEPKEIITKSLKYGAIDFICCAPFNKELIRRKVEIYKKIYFKDKRIGQLLQNIFPENVLYELAQKNTFSPKKIDHGVVIFTDFVDFSSKAKQLRPISLIKKLNRYFSKFDEIISKYKLEKIKTIGDAYMALGGVTENNPNPALRACLAAIEIKHFVHMEKEAAIAINGDYWDIRIGIHMGALVSGVIGTSKLNYDIWGDTVNIAQRTEQYTLPGTISITKPVYEYVKNYFYTTNRGEIDLQKRGGAIEMYFLEKIRKEYSMYEEGFYPGTELRLICGLSRIDFHQLRKDLIHKLKSLIPEYLCYHDIQHFENVEKSAIIYGKLEGCSSDEIILLRTAALLHDAGYILSEEENEEHAINLTKNMLPKYGYSNFQIMQIAGMINATKPDEQPKNLLEAILHDADFDYLGRADYPIIANKLRIELEQTGKKFTEEEWIKFQLHFLENVHRYYTETAINLRERGKQQRIKKLKLQLRKLLEN